MIAKEAWGEYFDADLSSEGGAGHDDESGSYTSDYGYQDSVDMSGEDRGPDTDDDESMSVASSNQGQRRRFRCLRSESEDPSTLLDAFPQPLGPMDSKSGDQPSPPSLSQEADLCIDRLNVRVHQQFHVQDESGYDHEVMRGRMTVRLSPGLVSASEGVEKGDQANSRADEGAEASSDDGEDTKSISSVGTDGGLPELSVTFADPEGSHFKELLYWVSLVLQQLRHHLVFAFVSMFLSCTFIIQCFHHTVKPNELRE